MKNRGFTLVEVLVALTILGVTFSTLFYLLGKERKELSYYSELYQGLLVLSNRLEEGNLKEGSSSKLEYGVVEHVYRYGKAEFKLYSR